MSRFDTAKRSFVALSFVVAGLGISGNAWAQSGNTEEELIARVEALPWKAYPADVDLAGRAKLSLSKDLEYLDAKGSSEFIVLNENPPPSQDTFIVSREKYGWFSTFTFDPSGYVKDDEEIDADALLDALKAANREGLEERKRLGLPALTLVDWYVPPHYDKATNRLEWGLKLLDDQGEVTVNYTVRLLGRSGVMSATLVSSPESLEADVKEFKSALNTIRFNPGENYAEFRDGDKVAAYGLGALVVGGAAAAAAKSGAGAFKAIGIAILAAGAAVVGFLRRLWGSLFKARQKSA